MAGPDQPEEPPDDADDAAPFEELDPEESVEDPFAELAAGDRESPDRPGSEEPSTAAGSVEGPDPFEEVDVGDLDEEDVWAALSADEEPTADVGGEATPVETDEGIGDHVVKKREYCQRCPHFTEPPTTACSHEGTAIIEVVSADEFRVRGCPMVSEEGPTFKRE